MIEAARLPTVRERSRRGRLAAPLATAGAVGVLTVALRLRDPHDAGSWGACPLRYLTGFDCPGCGGLRAVHDLTHLDLAGAASSNLLLVIALPLLVAVWAAWLTRAWRGRGRLLPTSRPLLWGEVALAVTVLFGIARNLPGPLGSWLAA